MSLVPGLPLPGRAAVRAGVVGNFVDQVNIFLPVVALAPALSSLAGPRAGVTTGALVVVATLLGRPLGAMIFGRIADRLGRTATTKIAIAGTAASSLAIAAVPSHHLIGAWAISAVVLLRFVGGAFLAGEYTSAIPLAMEWSVPRRRGLLSGLIMSMAPWAQSTIAFATTALIAVLGRPEYAAYGWRFAFLAGGTASLLLLVYYSTRVADAPQAQRHSAVAGIERGARPGGLRAVLGGRYAGAFWQMFGLMSGLWLMTNMVVILLAGRLAVDLRLDGGQVALVMGAASVAQAVVMSLTGHASSVLGRRRFFVGWGVLAGIAAPVLWLGTLSTRSIPIVLGAVLLQAVTVCGYGPVGAYLCERFPASVRSTGYGTAYSLSIVAPALWPWWLPTVQQALGHDGAVVAVLAFSGSLVAACGALGPRLGPDVLDRDVESLAVQTRHTERTPALVSEGS
ncbi:MFS transporter [Cumulibacter manganitolerans]|uniref:MFS transporter n=1 Tax=Cumulibacter manganitolerans TaxID=1884992 RepID=UPI0012968900|nr:MFS transporter [Cumulibacter manganitolerans]